MERVDVEIEPWIPEDVRRALDMRLDQEEDERQRQHEELEKLRFDVEVIEKMRSEAENARTMAEGRVTDLKAELELAKIVTPLPDNTLLLDEEDLNIPEQKDLISEAIRAPSLTPTNPAQEIPLSTLLRNYVFLLAQDRRNIALGLLTVLVILLSIRLASPQAATIAPASTSAKHSILGYNDNNQDADPIIQLLRPQGNNSTAGTVEKSIGSVLAQTRSSPTVAVSIPSPSGSAEAAKEPPLFRQDAELPLDNINGRSSDTSLDSAPHS
jgi:hypothetical protein